MKRIFTILPMIIMVFMAKAQSCPDDNHPHAIDLGLPSGTKWACCNVDPDHPENQSPTNYGGYYAWGETDTKSTYSWSTYTHCDGSVSTCHNLGSDIAGTQYDVAHVKWGGSWVMPSKEQLDELKNNCPSTWTMQNGVRGRLFTGTNGGSIFLPAAGYRDDSYLIDAGSNGIYWSSTHVWSWTQNAYYLYFGYGGTYDTYRYLGFTVRPVIDEITSTNLPKTPSVKTNNAVYNLFGIKVADFISGTSILRPGIYIVNGKKKVIK